MALDLDALRGKKEKVGRRGGSFWRPGKGRNLIRVFTFEHKVTADDVKTGLYKKSQKGKEKEELEREVHVHFVGGPPIVCSGQQKCPICKKVSELYKSPNATDKKTAKSFGRRTQYALNIVDVKDVENGVQVYTAPQTVFGDILGYILDPDYGEEILGLSGRDFIVEYDPDEQGSNMYKVRLRDATKSKKLKKSLEKEIEDLMAYENFTPGRGMERWEGEEEEEGDDDDDDKVEAPNTNDEGDEDEGETDENEKPDCFGKYNKKKVKCKKCEDAGECCKDEEEEEVTFKVGQKVKFVDDGEEYSGIIISIGDETAVVEVDDDGWEVKYDELSDDEFDDDEGSGDFPFDDDEKEGEKKRRTPEKKKK